MLDKREGVFGGLKVIANDYLLDPTWKRMDEKATSFEHKTNCLQLSSAVAPAFFEAEAMVGRMFEKIQNNISDRPDIKGENTKRTPSSANWDINFRDKSSPEASEGSERGEVTLERAIILARRSIGPNAMDKWAYQMPVATGLFDGTTDKSSNIDLVRKRCDGVFDLFELKIDSNNPVYAAVELLQYGLAYAASRELAKQIGYDKDKREILNAEEIHLCVLAPQQFYKSSKTRRYNFSWLEEGLNNALLKFSEKHQYQMTFKFCVLDLEWVPTANPTKETLSDINVAIKNIHAVPWGNSTKE